MMCRCHFPRERPRMLDCGPTLTEVVVLVLVAAVVVGMVRGPVGVGVEA